MMANDEKKEWGIHTMDALKMVYIPVPVEE